MDQPYIFSCLYVNIPYTKNEHLFQIALYGTTQSQTERTVRKRLLKYTTNTSKIHFLQVDDGSEYDSDESGEGNEENQMEE